MYGLALGKVDADDLPLDLGTHDVGVVRNHRADTAKIDRHVMLVDRPATIDTAGGGAGAAATFSNA